jgi:hypothetical protein
MPFDKTVEKGKAKEKNKDMECNCRIEVDDSLVIILCGDVDINRLRDSLESLS